MKIFLYFPSYFPHFYNIILGYHRILLYHSLFYFGTRFFVYISVNSTEGEGSEFIVSLRFAVDQESLKNTDLEETHIALNDRTNEGLRHKIHPCFSVQYHPEASPGPEDANYLFDEFIDLMESFKNREPRIEKLDNA